MREVLDATLQSHAAGRASVLCSVVETRGSTPQKPGAAMTVFPDGSQSGTLGGGCTEAEVRRHALTLFEETAPKLFRYTLDDDYGWDDGLICGGRMTFLAQPLPAGDAASAEVAYFQTLADRLTRGVGYAEAVSIDSEKSGLGLGVRFLFGADEDSRCIAALHAKSEECPEGVRNEIAALRADPGVRPKPFAKAGVAYLPVSPRCRLLIVGAGHVGQAVAQMARMADFEIHVLDDREKFANAERFPMAEKLYAEDIGEGCRNFPLGPNDYALIMTRGHSHDEEALLRLANRGARYVGLIGSKRKIKLIFDDLERAGIPPEALARVHAPLGVDIGSQTVPEIAISIVAELIGHRNRGESFFPPNRFAAEPTAATS